MPVKILSPYSGRPVMVREQDLGRAIRDEQGRVFYVIDDAEHGRYASKTRKGSEKDLHHYRGLWANGAVNGAASTSTLDTTPSDTAVHDATGVKRRNPVGIVVLLVLALLVAAGGYVVVAHPEWLGLPSGTPTAPEDDNATPSEQAPAPGQPADQGGLERPRGRPIIPTHASYTPSRTKAATGGDTPSSGKPQTEAQVGPAAEPLPETETQAPADQPADDTPDAGPGPSVGEGPATAPGAANDDQADTDADAGDDAGEVYRDPEPVIVPARTWRPQPRPADHTTPRTERPYADFRHTATGLRYKTTHLTDGAAALAGSYLRVRYTASALDGEPLIDDASQAFVLMTGQAIRAFDEGLAGMRQGEQRLILVPRGHSENGRLPGIERVPDQPFILDVQLVEVRPGVTHVVETLGDTEQQPALPGDTVLFDYAAWVEGRAEPFDSSASRGQPMRVTLGGGGVIPGLELGLAGIRPGETRLLTVPPYLAYGDRGVAGGLIPPGAVLTFRVTARTVDYALRPDESADNTTEPVTHEGE